MADPALVDMADSLMVDEVASEVVHSGLLAAFNEASEWLVHVVHKLGYVGIFIMTFLESTFMPIPSEVTMIPAGYLVHQGHMNMAVVLMCAIAGTILGALANYFIALYFGRRFLQSYGKYLFFSAEKMEKLDRFFAKHGEISTFAGRLLPGLRHFISFPAGLARMNLRRFCLFTGLGGAIWMSVLLSIGYVIGDNKELLHRYMPTITAMCVVAVVFMVMVYIWFNRRANKPRPVGGSDGIV